MKKFLLVFFALILCGSVHSQMVLLSENMDSYAVNSFLGIDNPTWFTTWSNLPGSGEDAQILTTFAHSGTKSASADLNGGQTDCVLKLGDKTTGRYELKWWMYVENGKAGYYNIQHFQTPGVQWAFEIYFRTNGDIHLLAGTSVINGTYPKATWFEVKQIIKLDADSIYLYINGSLLYAWPFHWTSSSTTGTNQLGGVDLFAGEEAGSGETPGFYFDDVTFSQLGTLPPTVTTMPASAINYTTATLNGSVNANIMNTTVTFEYGLTTAYGTTVPGVPGTVTGNTPTPVSADLSGLLPGNTYHYRVRGVNVNGAVNGLDAVFNTPPAPPGVLTTDATDISSTGATLNGTVDAGGASTAVTFEYGLTTAYGTTVPGVPGTVTGNGAIPVSAVISGLVVNNTYHFRVNGVSSVGTSHGNDMTFYTVDCPLPGQAGTITGPATACTNSGGYVYTVPPVPNATGYTWTVPPGSMISGGGNTNSITVTFGTTPGNITVMGTNNCGNGGLSTKTVTLSPAPVPTIAGMDNLCVNSGYYAYTTEAGMTNYTWTVSPGGTIATGAGTNTIQVSWNMAGAQSVNVNYTNSNGCMATEPTVLPVTVNGVPGAAGSITGTPILCEGAAGVSYSVGTIADAATYIWNIPPGATIASGAGTNTITIDWNNITGSQTITVYGNNLCGNGTASPPYAVTIYPTPPTPVITVTGNVLFSNVVAGNQWYMDGILIPGATEQHYTATQNGEYWDIVTLNNCISDSSNHIDVVIIGINDLQQGMISVYPNPNDGQFTVKLASVKPESFNISVINNIGMKILEIRDIVVNGNIDKTIDLRPASAGYYSVVITNGESTIVKKIVVTK